MSTDAFVPSPEQKAVIEHPATPVLVVAGAGSGKTESMARRILHLVQSDQAEPSQVMALTFTNKAAAELAKRVRERLGADTDVLVSTYHGFAASLVSTAAAAPSPKRLLTIPVRTVSSTTYIAELISQQTKSATRPG